MEALESILKVSFLTVSGILLSPPPSFISFLNSDLEEKLHWLGQKVFPYHLIDFLYYGKTRTNFVASPILLSLLYLFIVS